MRTSHGSAADRELFVLYRLADIGGPCGQIFGPVASVVVLRYYEGLSDQEIADVLGCKPGTVRGHASRALAALRVELTRAPAREPVVIKEEG